MPLLFAITLDKTMTNQDGITIDRATYDRLRQCAGLADVLREQLETVLDLGARGVLDGPAWETARLTVLHAGEVLR